MVQAVIRRTTLQELVRVYQEHTLRCLALAEPPSGGDAEEGAKAGPDSAREPASGGGAARQLAHEDAVFAWLPSRMIRCCYDKEFK